ncbi:DUF6241 domain-containing protein [Planococcus shenhongbingii]|uniref:DUF6241 domain-containing protein n=1 Tax=Planococcus shenhongbingii TaxID=3058398 RepID=A0ABT8NEJ0_9BACL|nr:DUF6241 domain-containing protein [Planococcus sp. N017]MDN7246288.1 DUF6241 domain-containing protein [Planococcus sp. N017]
MKKVLLMIGGAALAGLLLAGGIIGYEKINEPIAFGLEEIEPVSAAEIKRDEHKQANIREVQNLENMNELLISMHKMTHQKVASSDKRSALEMSEENINSALELAESTSTFEAKELSEMLKRWQERDFSEIVEDHNRIWKLQDGTVGEAVRALTPEEEQEFIEKHFK